METRRDREEEEEDERGETVGRIGELNNGTKEERKGTVKDPGGGRDLE